MVAPFSARPHSRRGTPAAPGRALGPAYHAPAPALRPDLITADPAAALRAAIARAVEALRDLAREVEAREARENEGPGHEASTNETAEGAGVLDFQIEMLLDEEILVPALARIARGEGPALAWAGAMGAYIDAFAAAGRGDDAFAARVADLVDLRQRVLDALTGEPAPGFPAGSVYVAADMAPSVFLAHDWSGGGAIALTAGSALGHVALLARSRGVPMVISLGPLTVEDGQALLVDGDAGIVWLDPPALPRGAAATEAPRTGGAGGVGRAPALLELAPGTALRLSVNINTLADLDLFDPADVDGIGLVRTEFMFPTAAEALNEACHLAAYQQILARLGGRPVTIRMLDLGGDKVLPGVAQGGAASLLGQRGVRLLLAHTDLARIQVRALLRAAALGPVSVLLPMVTTPEEVATMALLFAQEHARLVHAGIAARRPPLGMMVEVPAAALTLDLFEAAEFFSVGTNDLMQYLSAAARDNPAVASLNARSETALFRLLDQVHAAARAVGKPVSVCGDLAGEPQGLARLMNAGFRDVSVAPGRLAPLRRQMAAASAPRATTPSLTAPSLAVDR